MIEIIYKNGQWVTESDEEIKDAVSCEVDGKWFLVSIDDVLENKIKREGNG